MLSVCNSKMIALKKIGKKGQFICKLKNIIEIDRFKMLQYISNIFALCIIKHMYNSSNPPPLPLKPLILKPKAKKTNFIKL